MVKEDKVDLVSNRRRRKAAKIAANKAKKPKDAPKIKPVTLEDKRHKEGYVALDAGVADEIDELSPYLSKDVLPKLFVTTKPRPSSKLMQFVNEFMQTVPSAFFYKRGTNTLKEQVVFCRKHKFTHLLVFGERLKKPDSLIVSHLGLDPRLAGPTAFFRITSARLREDIKNHGKPTEHLPEVVCSNFGSTALGGRISRLLYSLFPHREDLLEYEGRQVVTFRNQRDFIFLRHHRYVFVDGKKHDQAKLDKRVQLQELGPSATLRLLKLQSGAFDTKRGAYEFVASRQKEADKTEKLSSNAKRTRWAL